MDELLNLEPIELEETDDEATAEWPTEHECAEEDDCNG